jgi:hypothetical protein
MPVTLDRIFSSRQILTEGRGHKFLHRLSIGQRFQQYSDKAEVASQKLRKFTFQKWGLNPKAGLYSTPQGLERLNLNLDVFGFSPVSRHRYDVSRHVARLHRPRPQLVAEDHVAMAGQDASLLLEFRQLCPASIQNNERSIAVAHPRPRLGEFLVQLLGVQKVVEVPQVGDRDKPVRRVGVQT